MIKSKIEIHDKFSVVINVTYDTIFKKKRSKYTTITYLFFADTLNINSKTYPATKFYNDVRLFLKYDAPKYTLNDINIEEDSLFKKLINNTEKFIKDESVKNNTHYKEQVKMFAATLSSLISKEIDSLIRKKEVSPDDITSFLEKIDSILLKFRSHVVFTVKESTIKEKNKNAIFYADEHISNVVELQLMKLFIYLQNNKFKSLILNKVVNLINSEQNYKKQKGYDSPKDKNINPEELLFKRNQLKKYIDSVFFLKQDIRKDGAVFEQTLLALAAGLAMIFSTGIAFYYQQVYGNFTLPFFIALVVGYMLKDRIKGFFGSLFMSKSNNLFYNYKINITNSLGKRVGSIKEVFSFAPYKKLNEKIKKYRQIDLIVKSDSESLNEHVIQYKKKIEIYPEKFGNDLPDEKIIGLTDSTRLNFHRFIQYMDNPKKEYILIKKGEVYNKIANKIYHINIIQKYYTEEGIEFNRYRVIMNRNGIRRIEKISL
ncbi:hypothetical protein SAMN05216503_0936 [Polaribacter sp. KT25b]|uniref:hypothetical protein n=1 Tax=Polaribacter sp. KT25b TaxID=1855336 RepID=UPI00087C8F39|nr:hypothetical protein [Polaribacter sp. KT25b]SDR79540.1 hypothetical protein SAMN05216503_0936 [Polaribacter sp. KT25b]